MPFLLRYISGPILAIIFSFAFPEFHTLRYDPMMIAGFILSLLGVSLVLFGFVAPRYYGAFIPAHRKMEGKEETVINEDKVDSIVLEEGAKEAEVLGKRSEVIA
jgi:solute carrier family 6 GABA transporter-like protein 1